MYQVNKYSLLVIMLSAVSGMCLCSSANNQIMLWKIVYRKIVNRRVC